MLKSVITSFLLKTPVVKNFLSDYFRLREFYTDVSVLHRDKNNIHHLSFSELKKPNTSALITELRIFGSDKVSRHSYGDLYEQVLSPFETTSLNFLEIGIHEGASLKAICSRFPMWSVFGVDIREDCLINDEKITSFRVDQFSDTDWSKFRTQVASQKFKFVIDDGFHTFQSSLITFMNLRPCLSDEFTYFIEDIVTSDLHKWKLLAATMPNYRFIFVTSENLLNNIDDDNILVITPLTSTLRAEISHEIV